MQADTGAIGAAPAERVVERKYKLQFAVEPAFMEMLGRMTSLLSMKHPEGITFAMILTILMKYYVVKKTRNERQDPEEIRHIGHPSRNGVSARGSGRCTPLSRHIPQCVRDEVFVRDGGRCTFIGRGGVRCDSTWNLEIDRIMPYARGGGDSPENLRLLGAKHNRLAAERAYGKDHMDKFYG